MIDYTRSDVVAAVKAAHPEGIEAVVAVPLERTFPLAEAAQALAAIQAGHVRGKIVLMVA
ncbi:MAG: zinc-binding dehydrogenase [Candidatus Entotheonellia bacterium]